MSDGTVNKVKTKDGKVYDLFPTLHGFDVDNMPDNVIKWSFESAASNISDFIQFLQNDNLFVATTDGTTLGRSINISDSTNEQREFVISKMKELIKQGYIVELYSDSESSSIHLLMLKAVFIYKNAEGIIDNMEITFSCRCHIETGATDTNEIEVAIRYNYSSDTKTIIVDKSSL